MVSQRAAGAPSANPSRCLPAQQPRAWERLRLLLSGRGVCLQKGPWLSRDAGSASSSAARRWGNFPWEDSARTCCSSCADSALCLCHAKGLGLLLWSPTGRCLGLQPQAGQSQELPSPSSCSCGRGECRGLEGPALARGAQWGPLSKNSPKGSRKCCCHWTALMQGWGCAQLRSRCLCALRCGGFSTVINQ